MSRRFQNLLQRYAFVRRELDEERSNQAPRVLRLVRLNRLQLLIHNTIRKFVELSAIRRASRPRFVPALVHSRSDRFRGA